MISKFIKKIAIILPLYLVVAYFVSINSVSVAENDCTIEGEETGCCPSCSEWLNYCFVDDAPYTKCTADYGKCNCSGVWCNSAKIGICNNGYNKYQCDTCCCTVTGGCDTCHWTSSCDNAVGSWSCFNPSKVPECPAYEQCYDNGSGLKCCKLVSKGCCTTCCEPDTCEDFCAPWSDWSPCDCNTSKRYRTRYCDSNSLGCPELDDEACTPTGCCTVSEGTLSAWGSCQADGKQYRTCDGATCCGSTCGNCGGEILERDCLRIDGNIWSDDNKDGKKPSDYWIGKDPDSEGNYSCTQKVFKDFGLGIREKDDYYNYNPIQNWFCHGVLSTAYYHTGIPNNIKPESTIQVTLTKIMNGYDVASWEYINETVGSVVASGFGNNTGDIIMPKSGWVNVNWELKQQTYNLTINVKKIFPEITDLPNQCGGDIYDGALQGAQITITDADNTGTTVCSGTSNSEGNLTCPIWILQGPLNITASKTITGVTPETYSLRCPDNNVYVYDPGEPAKEDSRTAEIGLQTVYKSGWVSAIDSDIFANTINVVVPDGPTDNSDLGQTPQGFAKTLINSSSNTDGYLGFIFSESNEKSNPNIDKICPISKGFETIGNPPCTDLGGFSYNLISGGEHDSKWLENFSFKAPENADSYRPNYGVFESGKVYKAESSEDTILPNTYKIENGDSIAILYVEGDLTVDDNLTTFSNGRLLIVVDGSVTIKPVVGTGRLDPPFDISLNPHIMAGIIARGKIEFESKGSITESNFDSPVMVSAPLISKDSISFGRDLYHDKNATMPAESAKAFNKYLYLLSSLEREKSQDNLYFTGLTTYDLDWEYIY